MFKERKMQMDNILVNTQSSIKIIGDKIIYFDPYLIKDITNDADIIFNIYFFLMNIMTIFP